MREEEHAAFKDSVFDQFARTGRALANPHRLEILDLLAQGPRSVEAIAQEVRLPIAGASQHLQVLRGAGLVEVHREGQQRIYALAGEDVFALWQALRTVSEHRLADVDRLVRRFLPERAETGTVESYELLPRLATGDVVVLDVRPEAEHRHAHLPGARPLPVGVLPRHLDELPRDKELIVYCRGPYCVFADEAVSLLRRHGFRARRLREGLADWRLAGLPVAGGEETRMRRADGEGSDEA